MPLSTSDVKKIAHLARLNLTPDEETLYTKQLCDILQFVEQLSRVETNDVQPLANPLDLGQRLRPDVVTESDQRPLFQQIAPQVEAGLYLVPQVIESE